MGGDGRGRLRKRLRERAGAIRVRTTAVALLVVGGSLVIAAVAMVSFLERSLRDHARDTALIRAEAIADAIRSGVSSDRIALGDEDDDDEFVQVLDADGSVVMASPNLSGQAPVARLAPGEEQSIEPRSAEAEPLDEPFVAVAISSSSSGEPRTVIVGRSLETVVEAAAAARSPLLVAVPLLLLVVGAVTWRVVGRALAPVEAIRSQVEAVSTTELHRRVPDPPGKDEIARLARTMNSMLTRLEEGQRRQRRFVSDASHELRSPVATIRQHAEVVLAHPSRLTPRFVEVVLEEDVRLQRIVEDLLLLTRIDEGTLQIQTALVDLHDVMFEEAARLHTSSDLRVDVADVSVGMVSGTRAQLERLIRNLIENAARHARTTIALTLREGAGEVVLAVDDDGDGIEQGQRERIFDRFVRLEDARDRDSGGAGLGLAIVREIAALHGATVTALDSHLGGARFEVRFLPT